MEACGNASVTYFGCGDGYIKLHMIKLHWANIHKHTHCTYKLCGLYQCQAPGFDIVI